MVKYEELKSNTEEELRKILKFLNFSISREKMECVLRNSNGMFKRAYHLNFNPYSKENCETLNRHMSQTVSLLSKYNISYNLKKC